MKLDAFHPLNLGHRGASSLAPENTLDAFAAAQAAGADGVEFDVQLSKDGELVVIHDDRLERTTNGRGLVAAHTLAELKTLDAGSWFDARFAGQAIPILQDVFDLLGNQMLLNIEIKSKSGTPGGELEEKVAGCVRRNQLEPYVLISSFNPASLAHIQTVAPELRVGYLFEGQVDGAVIAQLRPHALHPGWRVVSGELVERAHAAGQRVNVWTVNEERDLRSMVEMGVDGIVTNFPQRLAAILRAERSTRTAT